MQCDWIWVLWIWLERSCMFMKGWLNHSEIIVWLKWDPPKTAHLKKWALLSFFLHFFRQDGFMRVVPCLKGFGEKSLNSQQMEQCAFLCGRCCKNTCTAVEERWERTGLFHHMLCCSTWLTCVACLPKWMILYAILCYPPFKNKIT